jgi:uncharacterized membrane protein YraQ (UPF0718 family)
MTDIGLRQPAFWRRGIEGLRSVWGMIGLILLTLAMLDPGRFPAILEIAVTALIHTAPYILIAVLLIAWLKASGAETMIAAVFEGRETRMILLAALFGGLAPFCSCEVIPFIAGLLALGAPLSAVMAFWLSSPLIDPPTLFITASALGWDFAIGKMVGAVAVGLMGGFAIRFLIGRGLFADPLRPRERTGGCCASASPFKGRPVWRFWSDQARVLTFREQALSNGVFLLKWLSIAYLLQGLLVTYVPADVVGAAVGGEGLLPIVIGALVGAPAYLNSYAAPPLVAGLMAQGMSAGAGMAFMMAGAVSCIPAMAAVWSLVRLPVFAAYVAFGFVGAVLVGVAFSAVV